jgi:hypothetical protein
MLTELKREQVVEIGARNKAGNLLEQAGYTLGLAKLDGDDLAELMEPGYLDEAEEAYDKVRSAYQDRVLSAEESKGSTHEVNKTVQEAKLWRKRVNLRAKNAARMGRDVPAPLLSTDGIKGVPGVVTQLNAMVKLIEANPKLLPGGKVPEIVNKGKTLAATLAAVDSKQEIKRLAELSEKVREFYFQKGLLLTAVKVINAAGRELHHRDPAAASKYNVSILNRHTSKKKSAEPKA